MDAIQSVTVPLEPLGHSTPSLALRAQKGDPESIANVAADFESLFVSMVLKEMRQTLAPDTLFGSDTSDAFGGLFDLYLSQHVVKAGGFGVARMVRDYLEARQPLHEGISETTTVEARGGLPRESP